jgi:hypothetical protein
MTYGPDLIGRLKSEDQVVLFSNYVHFVTGQLVRSVSDMKGKCDRKDYEALCQGLDTAMFGFADLTRFLDTRYMLKLSPDPDRNNELKPCRLLGQDITLSRTAQLNSVEG